jgi:hypothetical protein
MIRENGYEERIHLSLEPRIKYGLKCSTTTLDVPQSHRDVVTLLALDEVHNRRIDGTAAPFSDEHSVPHETFETDRKPLVAKSRKTLHLVPSAARRGKVVRSEDLSVEWLQIAPPEPNGLALSVLMRFSMFLFKREPMNSFESFG